MIRGRAARALRPKVKRFSDFNIITDLGPASQEAERIIRRAFSRSNVAVAATAALPPLSGKILLSRILKCSVATPTTRFIKICRPQSARRVGAVLPPAANSFTALFTTAALNLLAHCEYRINKSRRQNRRFAAVGYRRARRTDGNAL